MADGDGGDGSVDGADALAAAFAVVCVGGGRLAEVMAMEVTEPTGVTVVEMLWPLPLLLSVSVEAGWRS